MGSPPSNYEDSQQGTQSLGFEHLHPEVQRWIWKQNWTELRDAQELAIAPILAGEHDVIISAATASGKTEAAFLPICSRLLAGNIPAGLHVLCLSPLKALINDQYRRLEGLCQQLKLDVHRWHGDVPAGRKKALLKKPSGILIITPESLEALFVIHGPKLLHLFGGLLYTVVDELHSFMGSERGRQLQSLLSRIEVLLDRQVPRIALSATLGDMSLAAEFLRPRDGSKVKLIVSGEGGQELKLIVKGYTKVKPEAKATNHDDPIEGRTQDEAEMIVSGDVEGICLDLYKTLRGRDNLVFANRRRDVEVVADRLRRTSEDNRVPNEFWPHHGSLSKELREDVEDLIKRRDRPASVVCTNTLELGIDIGSVYSVAQIGSPPAVASMRQRLGRSGRQRNEPSIMRIYISEPEILAETNPIDHLRLDLVQTIAMVNLLVDKWYEPPETGSLHFSTLVQQTLSIIAQHGGTRPEVAWKILCETGPFNSIDRKTFVEYLRVLGEKKVIEQAPDGTILLGKVGERMVEHYSFYAAFSTPEEFRVVHGKKNLGTLPVLHPLAPDMYMIFAGRRWRIVEVEVSHKVISVKPAPGGRAPNFSGAGHALVHDRVRREMFDVYNSDSMPAFLDKEARNLLIEGRGHFRRFGLRDQSMIRSGKDVILFPWTGDKILNTIIVILASRKVEAYPSQAAICAVNCSEAHVKEVMLSATVDRSLDAVTLASSVRNKIIEKHDPLLSAALLSEEYAKKALDVDGARKVIQGLTCRRST